jgi:hypothetical protein
MVRFSSDFRNLPGFSTLATLQAAGHPNPIAKMRSFSPLPRDAQEIVDGEILKVGRSGLVLASDLLDSNLTRAIPNWLSFTVFTAQRASEAGRAKIGMTPNTRGEVSAPDLAEWSTPVAVIWEDWEFDARTLATAARNGYAIDTTMAEQATRNVNEKIEQITIHGALDGASGATGASQLFYGLPIYGVLSAPNAAPYAYESNLAWDDPTKTGADILTDITNMIALADAVNYQGPYTLYIPRSYGFKLSLDYTSGYPATILSRLLQIPGLEAIKVVPALPANRTILMQKTTNVFDFLVGMLPTNFSWATNPNMPYSGVSSMVAAVVIPRPKYDYNESTGIVLGNTT